ncbi:CRISPR-associated endonuclease Cas1 [Vulcanisaeta thermophila]|uniref:CRISPR-associated endonuclease Cas1 n=1 Tax=Vulcanisaeta thermophila TaxID=867917 RepID=UPI00085356E7|nr:CRISPR-associated endonuclease Cas1 [Vulcanisaeta thermophila]
MFIYGDKGGKPSLTLDVMEPFRPVVDKSLIFSKPRVELVNGYLTYESKGLVSKVVLGFKLQGLPTAPTTFSVFYFVVRSVITY